MATDLARSAADGGRVRVATLNAFGLREGWKRRRDVMAAAFTELDADLVALQEVVVRPDYDQVRDLANEMFGVRKFWHKRIVRSGVNTLEPYRSNPPELTLGADDHRPQLEEVEVLAAVADAPLAVEDGPAVLELDRERRRREHRAREREPVPSGEA